MLGLFFEMLLLTLKFRDQTARLFFYALKYVVLLSVPGIPSKSIHLPKKIVNEIFYIMTCSDFDGHIFDEGISTEFPFCDDGTQFMIFRENRRRRVSIYNF